MINRHMVGMNGRGQVVILRPPSEMTKEEALEFAAWLVAIAEPGSGKAFQDILMDVLNT